MNIYRTHPVRTVAEHFGARQLAVAFLVDAGCRQLGWLFVNTGILATSLGAVSCALGSSEGTTVSSPGWSGAFAAEPGVG
jgi:hypothetical protein